MPTHRKKIIWESSRKYICPLTRRKYYLKGDHVNIVAHTQGRNNRRRDILLSSKISKRFAYVLPSRNGIGQLSFALRNQIKVRLLATRKICLLSLNDNKYKGSFAMSSWEKVPLGRYSEFVFITTSDFKNSFCFYIGLHTHLINK